MSGFDPAAHRMVPDQRWFEDFSLGERFVLPSRTMTEALFAAFALASGDNHPVHYDVEYCRARGMPHMLAHGFQVAIQTAAGAGIFRTWSRSRSRASSSNPPASCIRSSWAIRSMPRWKWMRSPRNAPPACSACAAPCTTSAACW